MRALRGESQPSVPLTYPHSISTCKSGAFTHLCLRPFFRSSIHAVKQLHRFSSMYVLPCEGNWEKVARAVMLYLVIVKHTAKWLHYNTLVTMQRTMTPCLHSMPGIRTRQKHLCARTHVQFDMHEMRSNSKTLRQAAAKCDCALCSPIKRPSRHLPVMSTRRTHVVKT